MANVTYLLGAGASAGPKGRSLPTSFGIRESLESLQSAIHERIAALHSGVYPVMQQEFMIPPRGTYGKELIGALSFLKEISQTHPSLDTFARKLFLRNGPDDAAVIHQFKAALACYFVLLQMLMPKDQRYEHFFASILNPTLPGKPTLPEEINILTWNYDTQLERAFTGFTTFKDHLFQTISKGPQILRLNGVCLSPDDTLKDYHSLFFEDFSIPILQQIENLYRFLMAGEPPIHFAWEPEFFAEHIKDRLQNICSVTEIFVVIGYSFPFFNRDTDRLIFSQFPNLTHIEKIYVQVPREDLPAANERLKELMGRFSKKVPILMIEACDLFLLPSELDRASRGARQI